MVKKLGLLSLIIIFVVLIIGNIVVYKNDFRTINNEFIALHKDIKAIKYWAIYCDKINTKSLEQKIDLYQNMVDASVRLVGHGSGVFIDDDVILTAAHCLENVNAITIELSNGIILKSNDFYIDEKEDVGFIFVTADEPCIARMALSEISIGDVVYLVGRPFDDLFKFSLTKGILSHLDRDFPNMGWRDLLQTDANGGPGSSGGPLYNSDGNLVGMYVGHADDGGRGISLCESAKSILESYKRCKSSKRK